VSYHNTTESTGPERRRYQDKAVSQETKILAHFKGRPGAEITPSFVVKYYFNNSVPITSVRRALTNLTNAGELVKTNKQVKGPYGRPEFQWRLADKYKQQEMFL